MKLNLIFLRETEKARLYRRSDGTQIWVPRSVIKTCLKHPPAQGGDEIHELDLEPWFARTKGLDQ